MTPESIQMLRVGVERFRGEVERTSDMTLWPGAGVPPEKLTTAQRRGRFYAAKCATQTLALLRRHEELLAEALRPPDWRSRAAAEKVEAAQAMTEEELEWDIAEAEAEAERLLDQLRRSQEQRQEQQP